MMWYKSGSARRDEARMKASEEADRKICRADSARLLCMITSKPPNFILLDLHHHLGHQHLLKFLYASNLQCRL